MNENISLFGKIAARSFIAWLSVTIPGMILCIASFIISLILFPVQGSGFAGSGTGGAGAILGLLVLLINFFWPTLLLLLALGGMILFSSMASGYGIRTALSLCWENKLGDYQIAAQFVYQVVSQFILPA